ncbi:IQ motif and ankyrin repeat domain-containing protein 1-like [Saccostrea cucullata]|uniref:IQ motif and ankyrin repeat domain-containing protein 1-like n=1 Tax=Saccostrea cuccullata TaxID=36930 RepID=UPI002ED0B922
MPPKAPSKTVKTTAGKGGTAAKPAAKASAPKATSKEPKAAAKPAAAVPVEKPPEHTMKKIAQFVLNDADKVVKNSKWFPMVIDPSEIAGRFLQYGECTYVNGLDQGFMTSPDRARIAVLAALRHGKKVVIDMMGADLYESIFNLMEQVEPGMLESILNKSIMEDEKIEKLIRPEDDDIYRSILQYGMKEDFGFVIVTNSDKPNGFTDKMMNVKVEN